MTLWSRETPQVQVEYAVARGQLAIRAGNRAFADARTKLKAARAVVLATRRQRSRLTGAGLRYSAGGPRGS